MADSCQYRRPVSLHRAARQASRAVSGILPSSADDATAFVRFAAAVTTAYRSNAESTLSAANEDDARFFFENRSHGRVAEGSASRGTEDEKGRARNSETPTRGGAAETPVALESTRDDAVARSNDAVSCGVGGGTFAGGSHDDSPVFRLQ